MRFLSVHCGFGTVLVLGALVIETRDLHPLLGKSRQCSGIFLETAADFRRFTWLIFYGKPNFSQVSPSSQSH